MSKAFVTIPLFKQVRDAMAARIATGEWKPNSMIPNELGLTVMFGVSNGTIRKALEVMRGEGLIVRIQGRGTFICGHESWEDIMRGPAGEALEMLGRCRPSDVPGLALMLVDEDDEPIALPGQPNHRKGFSREKINRLATGFAQLGQWLQRASLDMAETESEEPADDKVAA
jgi:DNA-binding transcriptional regulator YhcF (GntR family)